METKRYSEELDLQNYWLVLKRRWLVTSSVLAATVGLVALATSMQRPNYQASGQVLVQSSRTTSLTGVGEKIGDLASLKREGNPLDTQAVVVQSYPILQQVIDSLQLKDNRGRLLNPEDLKLKVEPVTGTDVLRIAYTDKDPERAAAVVNQVIKAYINNNVEENQQEAVAAGEYIDRQLPRAEAELEQASEGLRQFRTQNQIVDLDRESSAAVTTISGLQDQLNQARTQLADIGTQEAAIQRQFGVNAAQAVDIASLSQNAGVQEVLAEYQRVQTRLAVERTRFQGKHPAIASLEDQEGQLTGLLQERVAQAMGTDAPISVGNLQMGDVKRQLAGDFVQLQVQRLGLERKIGTLTALESGYRQRAIALPTLDKGEGDLERRLTLAQRAYESLSDRLQEIEVAKTQRVGNARIIQPADAPTKPASSLRLLFLAGGGLVGLLLGIAAAFFVDMIDRSLKTVKEAEALYGYTMLGLIPKFETSDTPTAVSASVDGVSSRVIAMTSPRSMIHEAYQMLQANLKFISLDKKVKTIVVSSAVPREGKSEVAANLAAIMAQSGRRVLLVDADMRNPSQHHLWGLVNTIGLSNVVVDQSELRHAVKPITSNLSVLTAGVMPPNPLALIDSEAMTALLEAVAKDYDYVLFDTPPLAGTADAAVLGKMSDGVLVVVRPGVADSASATAAKSILARSEPNILGLVANGVNMKHEPDSYFYYTSPREQMSEKGESLRMPKSLSPR
ncbi:GumC family protein [Myxacorys almedinensis]|uniref:non-specific protein-tyrosine kinase n=1 Tax=Myxacorys almedinensis A TaxID=2690445 RepID=A0A8J7Z1H6_9CYAN|nr:polysaccharide biosynthesis tyrosine autokinase [Myxacorys almedinensis]NDJ16061.1 polysaccharide biosynthesis tyrosine autokinase [Myxacorys almedinensis A]